MARSASDSLEQQESMTRDARVTQAPNWILGQPTELIDREESLARVRQTLLQPNCHLLTVLGIGGVGKTRLALAAAESLTDSFPDGIVLVDLTEAVDVEQVPSLVVRSLGLQVDGPANLPRIKEYLLDRSMLLVLDNFEHVLPAAVMVAELLEGCPTLKILATSREPLHLRWEQRFAVVPLRVPDQDQLPPPGELQAMPSVALFLQRARAVNMGFAVDDEALREIAIICARLDGLPLAIELAASRTNVLSTGAILARIEEQQALLRDSGSDVPVRHQSLDALLDSSYRFLPDPERAVFRRLGVFTGGFTLELAEAVAGERGEDSDFIELLASLIDKGLVTLVSLPDGRTRYRQLHTVRAYAVEQLRTAGETERFESAHARYFLSLAERESQGVRFGGYLVFAPQDRFGADFASSDYPWPAALDDEYANLVAALYRARDHNRAEFVHLAANLSLYWWVKGLLTDGARWLETALEKFPEADPLLRSRILGGLGRIYRQQGEFERARVVLGEAIALGELADAPDLVTATIVDLGTTLASLGRLSEATALIAEAMNSARERNDLWAIADASLFLGLAALLRRNYEQADALLNESLPLFEQLRDRRSVLVTKILTARVVSLSGDRARALALLGEAMELYEVVGEETLAAMVVEVAVGVLANQGAPEARARLLGAADGLRVRVYTRTILERENFEEIVAALTDALGTEKLCDAMASGRQWSSAMAIAETTTLIDLALSARAQASAEGVAQEEAKLSEREREVLRLLAEGRTNKAIGEQLGISENTAKFHVTSILTKLQVRSRFEAVSLAMRRNLI